MSAAVRASVTISAQQLSHHLEKDVVGEPLYEHELSGRYLPEAFFGPGTRDACE
jgi:hypothetical protein